MNFTAKNDFDDVVDDFDDVVDDFDDVVDDNYAETMYSKQQ